MGSTLHHFEGYKTLGPKMETGLINLTLKLTFNTFKRLFTEVLYGTAVLKIVK
jgi:hypothetical protein